MNLTESTLRNPAGAAVGIALVFLFGFYSLSKLPVQLFPDMENPQINIQTSWRAASPNEMEAEILEPIEEVLQGLPGVKDMDGSANTGFAFINLTFAVGTDMQKAMVEVISRMNRLPPLPRDADQPVITLGGWDGAVPALTWFFLQVLPGNNTPVLQYTRLIEDVIAPAIEAVPGVARAEEQTLGARLAQHVPELAGAVRGIDGDQHQPGERRAQLEKNPLGPVRRPDGDVIAGREAEEECPRRVLALGEELGVGPAPAARGVGIAFDQRNGVRRVRRGVA